MGTARSAGDRSSSLRYRYLVLFRFGCLFVFVPFVELALLIRLGQWMGLWPTLGLVAATGLLGAALARREGLRALTRVQSELAGGRLPARPLMDGAAVLVGGAFLLTPGVLTDLAGFGLLLPPTRSFLFRWLRKWLAAALAHGSVRMTVWGASGSGSPGGERYGERTMPRSGPRGREPGSPPDRRSPRRSDGDEDDGDEDDGAPPRPGEIIQR